LAFGFGNIAMLGWLGAVAAPLLIHLWSRHRFREAPWAAMQFLLAAMRKNARRMRLQQWLLLAVRTLIIMLVVLAVAEPYGERSMAGSSSVPQHRILVIDDSFSMAYQPDRESLMAQAKRLAAKMVRNSRADDVFSVIRMSSPARILVGPASLDHAATAAQIESINGSQTTADLSRALNLIKDALSDEGQPPRAKYLSEVYFFTDLQNTTWGFATDAAKPSPNTAKVAEDAALKEIAKQASTTIVNLGTNDALNLAVTELTIPDPIITPGSEISFDATLRQFGKQPRPQCNVVLLVDGQTVGEQAVDVPAGGTAIAHFRHRIQSPGLHTVCARTAGDQLSIDNSRWISLPVRAELRVLCVAGRDGAAKYLSDALNPDPGGDSKIRPVIISDGDFADAALADYDCVFLCNVAQLTAIEAERLSRYAEQGGGIVAFLGDRVIPENYNALASGNAVRSGQETSVATNRATDKSEPQTGKSLVPAKIGKVIAKPQFGIDPVEYRHPIVAPFRGRERAGLLTTPISRYHQLTADPGRHDVEIAAALPDGNPFIIAAPLGRGRVILVATDASTSSVDAATGEPWTAWPTWPSFLPLVRELLTNATASQRASWQQTVGSAIAGSGVSEAEVSALQIARPDGTKAMLSIHLTPSGAEWTYDATDLSGIYTITGFPQGQSQQFAVNVNTAESDLTKADINQLPAEIAKHTELPHGLDTGPIDAIAKSTWNQWLLWSVLAMMLAEAYMAWYFGRGAL